MDVIVIVFFHFYVLIRPEILLSGTRSTMGFATYTTLLNMYYLVPNLIVKVATGDLRSKQDPMVDR